MSETAAAVLMYHRVSEAGFDAKLLCVPPAEFAAQMRSLRALRCEVLPLEELADGLARGRLPRRAVALTFDDGYRDSLTGAAPILDEYGLPASFFVVTGAHELAREFWWDSLERALGDTCEVPARIELTISGKRVKLSTATVCERRAARETIKRSFFSLSQHDRDELVDALLLWSGAGVRPAAASLTMTASEIQTLASVRGMSVGSHTVNHLLLPAQTRDVRYRELIESKRSLEALLDRGISTLCYPYGGFDSATVAAAREAGYRCAVSAGNRPVMNGCDEFVMPRIAVRAGDDVAARLSQVFGR